MNGIEERKRKREEKLRENQSRKKSKKKKQEIISSESTSEDEEERGDDAGIYDDTIIVYETDDDDMLLEDENVCEACFGKEDWNLDEAWLGCSGRRCRKWFHKRCISDEVCKMTEKELIEFDFNCKICSRKKI